MQIEILREFVTLSITKNFSEAARRLNLSQPTLSRHMAMLERECGCRLFVRTRPMALTPSGRALIPLASDAIRSYDEFWETSKALESNLRGDITVQDLSFSPRAYDIITECESFIQDVHREVTFTHVDPPPGKSLFDMLEEGVADVVFVQTFSRADEDVAPDHDSRFVSFEIPSLSGNLLLAGRPDGPLAGVDGASDLKNVKFLSPTEHYLETFRANFSRFTEKHLGFIPNFEFREVKVHRDFYAQNPGDGVVISALHDDSPDDRISPPWLTKKLIWKSFPEFRCATYGVKLASNDTPQVALFVDVLTNKSSYGDRLSSDSI